MINRIRIMSSTEITSSETSFDTAKEELQYLLPNILQSKVLYDRRDLELSDTDCKSTKDSDGQSVSSRLLSKHCSLPNFYMDSCILTSVPNFPYNNSILTEDFDREKTSIPIDLNIYKNTPFYIKENGTFDKDRTPVIADNISPNLKLPLECFDNSENPDMYVKISTNSMLHYNMSLPSTCENDMLDSLKIEEVETPCNSKPPSVDLNHNDNLGSQVGVIDPLSVTSPEVSETEISISEVSNLSIVNREIKHVTSDRNSIKNINGIKSEWIEIETDVERKLFHSVPKAATSSSRKSLFKATRPNNPTGEINADSQLSKFQNEDVNPDGESREIKLSGEFQDSCMVRRLEEKMNETGTGPDVSEFNFGELGPAKDVSKDPSTFEYLQSTCEKHLSESAPARLSLYVKFDPVLKAISPISKHNGKDPSAIEVFLSNQSNNNILMENPKRTSNSNPDEVHEFDSDQTKLLDFTLNRSQELSQMSDSMGVAHIYSKEDFCQALRMQELKFQEQLLKKDKEWNERVKQLEKEQQQVLAQKQKSKETQQRIQELIVKYEKIIFQFLADRDKDKQETNEYIVQLKKQRDEALEDLHNVETAFSDLHRRYEKTKSVLEIFKKNEEVLKDCLAEGQVKLEKQVQNYDILKRHAEEKLECANKTIENLHRSLEAETNMLTAQLKKSEIKNHSMEKILEQRIKENTEIINICDELISKVAQINSEE